MAVADVILTLVSQIVFRTFAASWNSTSRTAVVAFS
jgi:hypothetical protein